VLAEADDLVSRPQLLAAYVEVMLAVGNVPAARAGCNELAQVARSLGSAIIADSDPYPLARALSFVELFHALGERDARCGSAFRVSVLLIGWRTACPCRPPGSCGGKPFQE
jgi:hypothetical protein